MNEDLMYLVGLIANDANQNEQFRLYAILALLQGAGIIKDYKLSGDKK